MDIVEKTRYLKPYRIKLISVKKTIGHGESKSYKEKEYFNLIPVYIFRVFCYSISADIDTF